MPGGWWHAVLNLTDTMAVTQNYMNQINFATVWRSMRQNRRVFASYFLKNLKRKNQKLHHKAIQTNIED